MTKKMRIDRLYKLFLVFVAALAFVSCGEDRTHEYLELTAENQWIYSQMKENYLWGDDMKKPERSEFFGMPSKFFNSLLASNDKASLYTDSASATSYGMKFSIMRDPLGEKRTQYYALVLFVEPGSPAAEAGIRRGTWISTIGGKALTTSSGGSLQSGKETQVTTRAMEYNDDEEKYFWSNTDTVTIQQALAIKNRPIYMDSVYSLRTGKAGYIVCNSLEGSGLVSQFSDIMLNFATEDVASIILDMRYCNGGTIENAASLASMLVPASLHGTPFAKVVGKNETDSIISYTEQTVNMSDKKLYIITSNDTKGIAELFIASVNASRGMHEVVTLGAATSGANLMTETFESPYGFSISPAVAYLFASDDNALQSSGILPDYPINETEDPKHIFRLGSEQEYILRNVEYLIVNGTLPTE